MCFWLPCLFLQDRLLSHCMLKSRRSFPPTLHRLSVWSPGVIPWSILQSYLAIVSIEWTKRTRINNLIWTSICLYYLAQKPPNYLYRYTSAICQYLNEDEKKGWFVREKLWEIVDDALELFGSASPINLSFPQTESNRLLQLFPYIYFLPCLND